MNKNIQATTSLTITDNDEHILQSRSMVGSRVGGLQITQEGIDCAELLQLGNRRYCRNIKELEKDLGVRLAIPYWVHKLPRS